MTLNPLGRIVETCWLKLPAHIAGLRLSEHVVMPNHMHGIVVLQHKGTNFGAGPTAKKDSTGTHAFGALVPGSVQVVVRSFKSAATKMVREHLGQPSLQIWQRGFYEHVIWSEKAYHAAINYIRANPARWEMKNGKPKQHL